MLILTCPVCGASGQVKDSDEFFEVRGQTPDHHWPIRKCRGCGSGLILKPRIVPHTVKVEIIPADRWKAMDEIWLTEFGDEAENPVVVLTRDVLKKFIEEEGLSPTDALLVVINGLQEQGSSPEEVVDILRQAGVPIDGIMERGAE